MRFRFGAAPFFLGAYFYTGENLLNISTMQDPNCIRQRWEPESTAPTFIPGARRGGMTFLDEVFCREEGMWCYASQTTC